jgi:hypothetical protein
VLTAPIPGKLLEQDSENGHYTGSLQAGKFADLIINDRNPFSIAAEVFGQIKGLLTMVGGRRTAGRISKTTARVPSGPLAFIARSLDISILHF